MFKQILLAAAALATIGTSVAAQADPGEHRGRQEMRHDRGNYGHDRRDYRHNGMNRGRYFSNGRYYHNRYRHHGAWMYR